MELIAEGRHSVEAVCRESGMSILELAAHVCTAQNIAALGRVAQLHAIEREMLLGRLKRDALMRLGELTDEVPAASADEVRAAEVMRKACADLLRNWESGSRTKSNPSEPRGPGGGGPRSRGYHPEPLTPAFEAEVLEALERLGEVREEEEYPQIPQIGFEERKSGSGNVYEPRAKANGSNELQPPETVTIRTDKMPVPLEICNGNEASKLSGEDGSRFEDGHPP